MNNVTEKNTTQIAPIAINVKWHARKGGGLFLGIRHDFPTSVIFEPCCVRTVTRASFGFLLFSISFEFRFHPNYEL